MEWIHKAVSLTSDHPPSNHGTNTGSSGLETILLRIKWLPARTLNKYIHA